MVYKMVFCLHNDQPNIDIIVPVRKAFTRLFEPREFHSLSRNTFKRIRERLAETWLNRLRAPVQAAPQFSIHNRSIYV